MVVVCRSWAQNAALGLLVAAALGVARPAAAFAFFGLFGSEDPPEPSTAALPYDVAFEVKGDDGVQSAMQDASNLYKLRRDAPPDGETLVQRAQSDFAPIIDALWSQGYYDARVVIDIAGVPLEITRDPAGTAARAANARRGRERVAVKITAETGPLFRLREVRVVDRQTGILLPPDELPPRILKIAPGDPARTADIKAANARLIDYFRRQSYPLVKAPPPAPVVDHASDTMDLTYLVETGPRAGIGEVTIKGPERFPQEVVRSFIYLQPGEPYSPDILDRTRKSVASIPAAGSVRLREGEALDAAGNLPIFVEVTDRAPNLVGFSAGFSTTDGPNARAYYENRNLFGGAERLRIQGDLFLAPRNNGSRITSLDDYQIKDIGRRGSVSFLKPALGGTRFDLLLDGEVERNRTGGGRFGGYSINDGAVTAALRYRIDDRTSLQAGVQYAQGNVSDVISVNRYELIGFPVTAKFDTTDKPLDPSTGVRVTTTITPYPVSLGSSATFTRGTLAASAYYALDEDARYVLAARVGLGAFLDEPGDLAAIPANYRFYVGGAGSVRGFRYLSVAPRGPFGFVVGGRSSFDSSFEARIKITDAIGIVPFFDAGGAYTSRAPDPFGFGTKYSAGLGLTYATAIGPIRLDVATPINPRRGDLPVVLYVSIGQSF